MKHSACPQVACVSVCVITCLHTQTSKIVRTGPFIAGLAGLYVITLLANAASGMVAPVLAIFQSIVSDPVNGLSLTAVGNLFLNNGFTALCWVHLLTLDFYMAR